MHRHIIIKALAVVALLVSRPIRAQQTLPYGPSDPTDEQDCGIYAWPEVLSPCPEVQIKQKHDHTPLKQYRANGWDTVVTCSQRSITLSCRPYLPVQYFNGQYTVDTIPFDPPDTTFALGNKMPVSTDDDFASSATDIPFSFFFFGIKKDSFVLGANGLITFNSASAGKYCPWKFSSSIPWSSTDNGAPHGLGTTVNHMRDAIYGIYEDTHPISSYLSGDQGIYYGVQDEAPCRKIICSWNGIPTFPGVRNKNNRCTYQIVCYEGSNIIEVHIKRRGINSKWQGARGLIGIQNATGAPQVKGASNETTRQVTNGAYAAYYPSESNLITDSLNNIAFRFTPQGVTNTNYHWYRIFDDGRDSVDLTTDPNDTNGYYIPMGSTSSCPTLTTAMVSPTSVSRYVFHLRFKDAANTWYDLADTITVGVDTSHLLTLRPSNGVPGDTVMDICSGSNAQMMMEFPELQDTAEVHYTLSRPDGSPLPDSLFVIGDLYYDVQNRMKKYPVILRPDERAKNVQPGEVDNVRIHLIVEFRSGCSATVDFTVRVHPHYDTTEYYHICQGETLRWHLDGNDYTATTKAPQTTLQSINGCDSVVHLDLTVYDVSFTVDEVRNCKPIKWQNGQTYDVDNTATAATDTVVLHNQWGCDSVVQLDFKIRPMTPIIDADLEYFDYDNLTVTLTDVSTGGDSRRWVFPNLPDKTDPVVYYTIPYEFDSVRILLVESSSFGCTDTDAVMLPFRREVIWFPNVFTPTADENNIFSSRSRHLLKEEIRIYNRYGTLVFECNSIDCPWDGTDGNGRFYPQGTYVYIVRYTTVFEPNTTYVRKGTITLIY